MYLAHNNSHIYQEGIAWLNKHLEGKGVQVDNIDESLKNGLNLIHALEHASGEAAGKYHQKASLPVHCIDNQNVALKFLTDRGVNTGGVTAEGTSLLTKTKNSSSVADDFFFAP